MSKQRVSDQDQWHVARRGLSASSYREFSARYEFDPYSRLRLQNVSLDEVLPRAPANGPRRRIFEEAFVDGATVEDTNARARGVARAAGGRFERDADIFIALTKGLAELERASETGTEQRPSLD